MQPESFGIERSFTLAVAVIIGGRHRILGPVFGVLIVELSTHVLGSDHAQWQPAVMGLIVIVAIRWFPEGLLPSFARSRTTPAAVKFTDSDDGSPGVPAELHLGGVTKAYGTFRAVDDLALSVGPGTCVAIIGPNGAGKSTALDIIAGLPIDSGRIELDGLDVSRFSPRSRARLGIGRTYQHVRLVDDLTVWDNVMVGVDASRRSSRNSNQPAPTREAGPARVSAAIELVGLRPSEEHLVASLDFGRRRLVELARLVASSPRLALLDEPSSGLDGVDAEVAIRVIHTLRARGTTVIVVEHDLDFVRGVTDVVQPLVNGRALPSGTLDDVLANPEFRSAYLGTGV